MNLLFGIFGIVPIWLTGRLLLPRLGLRRGGTADMPLEFAAGAGVLALIGTVLIVAGVRLWLWYVYVPLGVLALFEGARRLGGDAVRERAGSGSPLRPRDRAALALCAGAAVVLLVLLSGALHDRLAWDGFAIWALKARLLFVDRGLPADFWTRPGPFDFAHPDYPLAVPLLDWWLYAHAGEAAPALASFAGGVWLALLVWLFWSAAATLGHNGRWAAAATLGLAAFWPISYFAVGGTADVVMAFVFLGVTVELEAAARTRRHEPLLRAIVFLTLGALAKNEGLAAALVGGAAIVFLALRHAEGRHVRLASLAAVPFGLGLAWRLWSGSMGAEVEQIGSALEPGRILGAAVAVAQAFGRLAVHQEWPPLLMVIALGVWRWRRERLNTQTVPWLMLISYLVLAIGVYLTTEQDLVWLLDTSLGRVVSALVPAALYLTVTGLPAPAAQPGVAPGSRLTTEGIRA